MSTSPTNFYVTGGTLRPDAPSYVDRKADRDLYQSLLRGEFCYVLTSRQMGKSSLMVRTASKLRADGVRVIAVDLTAIGQNVSPEQWYDGLALRIGRQLGLEDELEEFWRAKARYGPCQRLFAAISDLLLPQLTKEAAEKRELNVANAPDPIASYATRASLVIFVDELDTVRSLPFSTDEFFAAIRECYNRRSEDEPFKRLTFCLLGVATPSDLIRDTRMTPFNIGQRIELTDFSEEEAVPLAKGLSRNEQIADRLLMRVYRWTNGHPYLTQRLCRALAEDGTGTHSRDVDRLCDRLFLSVEARERDDNLIFVRERMLNSATDRAALLELYSRVYRGKTVSNDPTNPLVGVLVLSGIARTVEGRMLPRNRIYQRVFDADWIATNMPDADVRRQRAAFKRGVAGATAALTLLIVLLNLPIFEPSSQTVRTPISAIEGTVEVVHNKSQFAAAGFLEPVPSTLDPSEAAIRQTPSHDLVSSETKTAIHASALDIAKANDSSTSGVKQDNRAHAIATNQSQAMDEAIRPLNASGLDLAKAEDSSGQTVVTNESRGPIGKTPTPSPPKLYSTIVLSIQGTVEIRPAGTQDWNPASTNETLWLGDRLRTGSKSRAVVRLSDLSTVRVGDLTTIAISPGPGKKSVLQIMQGSSYFFNRDGNTNQSIRTPLVLDKIRG